MKRTPKGKLTLAADFLPPPGELLPREQTVILELDESTVRFFKRQATKSQLKYQQMMREVLSLYARKFGAKKA